MKLNPDCVRDILLYLEENLEYVENAQNTRMNDLHWVKLFKDPDLSNKYSENDIKYSIQKLHEANFITAKPTTGGGGWIMCNICDITWEGHEFLNTVRGKTIWEATKERAAKISIASVKGMASIAAEISKAIITQPGFIKDIVDKFT